MFVDCDPSAHGEVVAIRSAGKHLRTNDLQGCSLYTNFEPCPMCTAAIWWSRFVSQWNWWWEEYAAMLGVLIL